MASIKDVTPVQPIDPNEQQAMATLRRYGSVFLLLVALLLAGYFGWTYWQNHGGRVDNAAANDFAKIQADQQNLASLSDKAAGKPANDPASQQLSQATTQLGQDLDQFVANHKPSVYTWQALMIKASNSNNPKASLATLKQASELKLNDEGLNAIATLRYAQALLADGQADAAEALLKQPLPTGFEPSYEELLGDIARQKKDNNAAIAHYQKAWQAIETRNSNNAIKQDRAALRLKMQQLGLNPTPPDLTGGVVVQPNASQINQNASAALASGQAPAASAAIASVAN